MVCENQVLKNQSRPELLAELKEQSKKAFIPGYGKKGMGWIKNPRKALYNKVYRKTTFSFWDLFK